MSNRFLKTCIAVAATVAAATVSAQTLTTFTLNTGVQGVATGSFQITNPNLFDVSQLTGSGNTYNFASQLFTPSTTGSYTFGMSSAPNDTVLILYSGTYNPAAPGTNALALSDDSDGLGAGGITMGTCGPDAQLCPKLTENLTANTDYYVVVTTFSQGFDVDLPIGFYVYGAPVGVGGAPPPSSLSVFTSSLNQTNSPSYGAAQVIDSTPTLLALFTGASLSGDQQVSDAASQTLPLLVGNTQIATTSALAGINRVVQARLDGNRGLSAGDTFYGDRHFWIKPFGTWARQSGQGTVAGFKADTSGMVMGLDGTLSPAVRAGVAFAWADSNIKGQSSVAPNSASVKVYQLVGYGSRTLADGSELNFQLDVGRNNNDGSRTIAFTNTVANSSYNTTTMHAGFGWGKTFAINEKTSYSPSLRLDYTHLRDSAYTETGAGLLNLDVSRRSGREFVLGADAKINHQLTPSVQTAFNAGLGYDFAADKASITAAFAGAPGAAFVTQGIDPDPWTLRAGFGLLHKTQGGAELSARLDVEAREGYQNKTASFKARWSF